MWILVILILLITTNLYAANPYKLGELDYFYCKAKAKELKEDKSFDWNEVSISASGSINYYTPPKPVLVLLETPTPENAKAYLAWQKQKIQKIMKAQEIIDQVIQQEKQQ